MADIIQSLVEWNLEVTSRCALACPSCTRTFKYDPTQLNIDLDVKHIKNFFTPEVIQEMYPNHVLFSGMRGDPIYHPKFHEIIKHFKKNGGLIRITTNGFGRSLDWWSSLNDLLTKDDAIIFSIDGLEDTNHIYRVNSKWDSVYNAISFMAKGNTKIIWKYIVFKHNQHQIEEAKEMAKALGIDGIDIVKSRRWPEIMKPDPRWRNPPPEILENTIEPRCIAGRTPPIISSTGYYRPCDGVSDRLSDTFKFFDRPAFDIKEHSLQEILESDELAEYNKLVSCFDTAFKKCIMICNRKSNSKRIVTDRIRNLT